MRHLKLAGSEKLALLDHIIDFARHNSSQSHKISVIEDILAYAPIKQRFFMVGDSGEFDPEVKSIV